MDTAYTAIPTLTKFAELTHADIFYEETSQSALVRCTRRFIPFEEFQKIFGKVEDLIIHRKVNKVVFDKRQLVTFDQTCMEWYYLDWKTRMMKDHGLKDHRKLLPNDLFFQKCVKIGKEKILKLDQEKLTLEFKISYYNILEDALK
jgi:hypothetical protein